MRFLRFLILSLSLVLVGCTTVERAAHMYSGGALKPISFQYNDGGSSDYYSFIIGADPRPDTLIFFYGGTGCPSWKSVMPG